MINTDNKQFKDYIKVFKRIGFYLRPRAGKVLVASLILIAANLLVLFGPYFSGRAIDAIESSQAMSVIVKYALLMALAYISSAGLQFILTKLVVRISQNTAEEMRQDTFDKIVDLPLSYIDSHHAGDLVSRISYDLNLVSQSLANDVVAVMTSIITVIGSLVMMISISPTLSIIFIIILPITIIFTIYRMKITRPLFSNRSRLLGKMNAYVEEILYGQKTISAYDKEDYFSDEFEKVNKESMDAYYLADYHGLINGPSVSLITNISLALIAIFGSLLFIRGSVSLGTLTAFILYSRRFSGPIQEIANIFAEMQSALSAGARVFRLLDQPSEAEDKPGAISLSKDQVEGEIRFENVDFSYEPHKPIIQDFSLESPPGSLTAIVGPTGSGKSTIINLLMRFYDIDRGEIFIDGMAIDQISRESLRDSFAMVLQESWLFQGSIRDNISYGNPGASQEEIDRVVGATYLDSFIESLPDGYDTMVSDGAGNLSQGQKQLISIARAMLIDAPMLILDEATSNVDSRTEIKIQEAMNKLMEGRTSIVIAHRLSTIQNADNIVVLVDGEIREMGNHEYLLSRQGFYSDLYYSQFS